MLEGKTTDVMQEIQGAANFLLGAVCHFVRAIKLGVTKLVYILTNHRLNKPNKTGVEELTS